MNIWQWGEDEKMRGETDDGKEIEDEEEDNWMQ